MEQISRNSAYSKRKKKVAGLQREPQKILKMEKHGDIKRNVKVDTKVKQLMTSETQKLKTDVDFQKESNIGVSSDVCKEKFQSFSKKLKLPKMKKPKSNGQKEGTQSGKEWFMKALFMHVKFVIDVFIKDQFSNLREILKMNLPIP